MVKPRKPNRWLTRLIKWGGAVIILYGLLYCFGVWASEGDPGYSDGIADSKKNGAFICEYHPKNDTLDFGNLGKVRVGEIWVEYPWAEGGLFSKPHNFYKHTKGGANYWLYIEIPRDQFPLVNRILFESNAMAVLTSEGTMFGSNDHGDKIVLGTTYEDPPKINEELRIIARTDSMQKSSGPQFWKNPSYVGSFCMVRDSVKM